MASNSSFNFGTSRDEAEFERRRRIRATLAQRIDPEFQPQEAPSPFARGLQNVGSALTGHMVPRAGRGVSPFEVPDAEANPEGAETFAGMSNLQQVLLRATSASDIKHVLEDAKFFEGRPQQPNQVLNRDQRLADPRGNVLTDSEPELIKTAPGEDVHIVRNGKVIGKIPGRPTAAAITANTAASSPFTETDPDKNLVNTETGGLIRGARMRLENVPPGDDLVGVDSEGNRRLLHEGRDIPVLLAPGTDALVGDKRLLGRRRTNVLAEGEVESTEGLGTTAEGNLKPRVITKEIANLYTPNSAALWQDRKGPLVERPMSREAVRDIALAKKQNFTDAMALQQRYLKRTEQYDDIISKIRTFMGAYRGELPAGTMDDVRAMFPGDGLAPSPAADLAMIFSFMKILDPTSVVRESEQQTAANARAMGDAIATAYERARDGTTMTQKQRDDFLQTAKNMVKAQVKGLDQTTNVFREIATKNGFDPDLVAPNLFEDIGLLTGDGTVNINDPAEDDAGVRAMGIDPDNATDEELEAYLDKAEGR